MNMSKKFPNRLSTSKKTEIAQNLVDILDKNTKIMPLTRDFIRTWVQQPDGQGKEKVFYDVWDLVLKKYMPDTRPTLFRSCKRRGKDGKIVSFTGQLECVWKFSRGKGLLIACDTKKTLLMEENNSQVGQYKHTFYPLVRILEKARDSGGWGFSKRFLDEYIGEDEYIMRLNLGNMYCFKRKYKVTIYNLTA